jgi:pimeloyl-ACP methyl ester carboxylesterase
MPKIDANGIKLNYFRTGSGPDLVLVHGLGANMAFWYPKVVSFLADRFRVTLIELRGHGASEMTPSGYDTGTLQQDLLALMDSLDISKAHIAGHSYGGAVALHFASAHPERVETLTLADAVVRSLQPTPRLREWQYWMDCLKEKYRNAGIELDDSTEIDSEMLKKLSSPALADAREGCRKADFFLPFGSWNGGRKSAAHWQKLISETSALAEFRGSVITAEMIKSVRCPVLVIYGEHSMFLETYTSLKGLIKDSVGVMVPGKGHFHPALEPEFFASALKAFIDGSARASSGKNYAEAR